MNQEQFETQSIYQAAYCLCIGLNLVRVDRAGGSKATLIFEGPGAQKKALGYYNNSKCVAKELFDDYRSLKDMIFKR